MQSINKLPDILTVRQLAEALQLTDNTIKASLYKKELVGFKVGRTWRIDKQEVFRWLEKINQ